MEYLEMVELMGSIRDHLFGEHFFIDWWASVKHEFPAVDEEHAREVFNDMSDQILEEIIQHHLT